MDFTVVLINALALGALLFAFVKDREKAKKALKVALKSMIRILPNVLAIIILIGLLSAFIPPEEIAKFTGEQSGFVGVVITALLGAILYIPSLISYPLAGSLLDSGASVSVVAAFITSLTMVGLVTLPLEIKEMGKEMALLRNGLGFLMAIAIALLMGVLL